MHILKEMLTNIQVSLSCEESCLIFRQLTQYFVHKASLALHKLDFCEVPPSKNQLTFRFPILRDNENIFLGVE